MRVLRAIGKFIWRFMIIFSFIVNIVLVIVVIALAALLFDIKNNIVTPLVTGLHSSFVGLDEATIDWTIPVRDSIPVEFTLPLEQNTTVVLTEPVPLTVGASISSPTLQLSGVTVFLTLPEGLELPVALDLDVPVSEQVPVELDVRAVIPLNQTQLHDPIENLRLVFEPIVRALYNLPDNYGETGDFVTALLAGEVNLLAENQYSADPWPGFSRTAGLGYQLGNEPVPPGNLPVDTGMVPQGGIPALDEQLRPDVYGRGGPAALNAQAAAQLAAQNVPDWMFDGSYGAQVVRPPDGIEYGVSPAPNDLGILPTPPPSAP